MYLFKSQISNSLIQFHHEHFQHHKQSQSFPPPSDARPSLFPRDNHCYQLIGCVLSQAHRSGFNLKSARTVVKYPRVLEAESSRCRLEWERACSSNSGAVQLYAQLRISHWWYLSLYLHCNKPFLPLSLLSPTQPLLSLNCASFEPSLCSHFV